jgi:DNA-binding transcriptional ArsR family regulator
MNGFAALADGTRREIVELLMSGEKASGEIAARFPLSAAAVSQHLKVLREARLVHVRTEAQRRIYALDRQGFDELEAWMNRARRFWQGRLDDLEAALREDQARGRE